MATFPAELKINLQSVSMFTSTISVYSKHSENRQQPAALACVFSLPSPAPLCICAHVCSGEHAEAGTPQVFLLSCTILLFKRGSLTESGVLFLLA